MTVSTEAAPSVAHHLAAVVVTHNRLDQLQTTVARLAASPALKRLIVVDNASTDGTGHWLAQWADPRLEIVTLPQNAGGAGGFAAGMLAGVQCDDVDWLVLMDDDARPTPGALEAFQEIDLEGWDALAAAVYLPADRGGGICEMNRPSRNPFWVKGGIWATMRRGRDGYHIPFEAYAPKAGIRDLDVTSFVGFFISKSAVLAHGVPESGLFLYGDDALYTLGMRVRGARIGFAPQVGFEHDCATFDEDNATGRMRPLWKAYYYHRNLLILYRLAAGWWFWLALGLVVPRWLWRLRAYETDRGRATGLLLRALRDGLARRTDVPFADVRRWAGD